MTILICLLIGVLTWPILEYSLHRFLGHVWKVNTLFKKEHTRHHTETNYFAPLKYKLAAGIPISILLMLLVSFLTGSKQIGITFIAGFLMMYSIYEYFHWTIHARAPKTKLGMKLRKHHLAHHFHSPKLNHGVTSTIIDKVMGTYVQIDLVKIPKKIPIPWIFEEGKETIDPKFKDDFQLK